MRKFHLGDVLSITTGRLLSPTRMDGINSILNYMKGNSPSAFQSSASFQVIAGDACKPFLLEQFPQLADVDASGVTSKNYEKWMAKQVAKFGKELEVKPMPA